MPNEIGYILEPNSNNNQTQLIEARRDAWVKLVCDGVDKYKLVMKLVKSPDMFKAIALLEDILVKDDHNYIPINNGDEYIELATHMFCEFDEFATELYANHYHGCTTDWIYKLVQIAELGDFPARGWTVHSYRINTDDYEYAPYNGLSELFD